MRGKQNADNVTDVTDAQERTVKGKLPRNVVLALGGAAALMVGALGYYFQTVSDEQIDAKAQQARADEIKQRAGSADTGQSLDAVIRAQADKAREESEKQRKLAIATDTKAPVMTAGDLTSAAKATGAAPDAKKNAEDDLFTSSVFKSGTRKSQVAQVKQPTGMPDVTDPAQMRAIQQAVAAKAAAANAAGATPEGVAPQASSSDRQFLRDAGSLNTLRTGFDGKLPRCTLSRGFVIPANFAGGLNSDKPGEFRATVSQDIYDTVKGTCKIIPAGTTLVGMYSADIAVGQERILTAFVRMQLPNGKTVPLMGMQGADPDGTAGNTGDVNNHFLKIFGGALVIGALSLRFNDNPTTTTVGPSGLVAYGNAAGQVATQTAQTILNRNQNIRPTITTEPGQKMMVQVKHDIVLEPYRD
ncbi:MAG: conjugal transfer protein TrbI [Cupriavidus sp.]|jgi:type IV secretion system protein VirB10|uniref:TrbI/VirB10 family protein n=1 Tax=Cupriavidus TaxID=106589 RepID=UPI0004AFD35F|nr:TrbI/VirB10 family protein [Cupriavidus pauculus]MBU66988.1 conjugal transfer protein TrbI [Cupriavidus sp.]MCM3608788.1 TrbI/VirB10 family protein [Cupriavidus pauculus]